MVFSLPKQVVLHEKMAVIWKCEILLPSSECTLNKGKLNNFMEVEVKQINENLSFITRKS